MTAEQVDQRLLIKFSPFTYMSEQPLKKLVHKAQLVRHTKKRMLYKRNSKRRTCQWLVNGSLDLVDANYKTEQLKATSGSARDMLEDRNKFQRTAVAIEDCLLLEIDRNEYDLILTVDQSRQTLTRPDDWMSLLLSSHLFQLIPPGNIQTLFSKFSSVRFAKGTKVVAQGEVGDYFYVVKEGALSVDRTIKGKVKHLTSIGPGGFFGEDALVRNLPRNATVTMLTTGILMRLGKEDFNALMVQPVSSYVTYDEVKEVKAKGGRKVILVDVRHPREITKNLSNGTVNIPLQVLRQYARRLDDDTVYVVTTPGRRAELAAFLLNQAGYDTYIYLR